MDNHQSQLPAIAQIDCQQDSCGNLRICDRDRSGEILRRFAVPLIYTSEQDE